MSEEDNKKFLNAIKEDKFDEISKFLLDVKFDVWEIIEREGPYENYSGTYKINKLYKYLHLKSLTVLFYISLNYY